MHGAQHTERSGRAVGAGGGGRQHLVCAKGAFPADDSWSLGAVSLIIIIYINAPEGCQHGTHSFSVCRVIKLIPPVLGIPAQPEQIRESQVRTPAVPGIVHRQFAPGVHG